MSKLESPVPVRSELAARPPRSRYRDRTGGSTEARRARRIRPLGRRRSPERSRPKGPRRAGEESERSRRGPESPGLDRRNGATKPDGPRDLTSDRTGVPEECYAPFRLMEDEAHAGEPFGPEPAGRIETETAAALRRKPAHEALLAGALRVLAPHSPRIAGALGPHGGHAPAPRVARTPPATCPECVPWGSSTTPTAPTRCAARSRPRTRAGSPRCQRAVCIVAPSSAMRWQHVAVSRHSHLAFAAQLARLARGESDGRSIASIAPKIKEVHRIELCSELLLPLLWHRPLPMAIGPALGVLRDAERHLGRWLVLGEIAARAGDKKPLEEARRRAAEGPPAARAAWAMVAWALGGAGHPPPEARPTLELVARLSDRPSADRDTTFLFRLAASGAETARGMLEHLTKSSGVSHEVALRAELYLARDYGRDRPRARPVRRGPERAVRTAAWARHGRALRRRGAGCGRDPGARAARQQAGRHGRVGRSRAASRSSQPRRAGGERGQVPASAARMGGMRLRRGVRPSGTIPERGVAFCLLFGSRATMDHGYVRREMSWPRLCRP